MFRIAPVVIFLIFSVSVQANQPLTIHFIDVGQGDSTFIQSPDGKTMLIDAGEDNGLAEKYLDSIGVKRIDILVATHPHLDHIGGLPKIVKKYEIGQIVMPRVTEVTTVTYRQLLEGIRAKGLRVTSGQAGLVLDFGQAVSVECLAPNSASYEDINDYSVVLKLSYGGTSFLFTGDATTVSEKEMLRLHKDKLKANVLRVAHHGSTSSSSAAFLKEIAPSVSILSVGRNNKYGHPTQTVLNRIVHTDQFRTDLQGTIIVATNGTEMAAFGPAVNGAYPRLAAVNKQPPAVAEATRPPVATEYAQTASDVVYVTKSGTKYHRSNCRSAQNAIPINRSEAMQKYGPCGICKP